MPPKIGDRVSPNGYAPEFSGAVFLQISYAPENQGGVSLNGYAPVM